MAGVSREGLAPIVKAYSRLILVDGLVLCRKYVKSQKGGERRGYRHTSVKTTWESLQWLNSTHNKTSGTAREVLDKMEKQL